MRPGLQGQIAIVAEARQPLALASRSATAARVKPLLGRSGHPRIARSCPSRIESRSELIAGVPAEIGAQASALAVVAYLIVVALPTPSRSRNCWAGLSVSREASSARIRSPRAFPASWIRAFLLFSNQSRPARLDTHFSPRLCRRASTKHHAQPDKFSCSTGAAIAQAASITRIVARTGGR